MSTLHHEALLETCFEEVCESFAKHNKLTDKMMDDLLSFSRGTRAMLEERAREKFEDLCQQRSWALGKGDPIPTNSIPLVRQVFNYEIMVQLVERIFKANLYVSPSVYGQTAQNCVPTSINSARRGNRQGDSSSPDHLTTQQGQGDP